MMERQAQLKRSIFELEMENQHLQEIKARMMGEIKLKYDDQD
jgi:CRISPR/Cas system-associated endoribonuclease Cas2